MSIAIPTTAVISIFKKMLMSEHRMGLHEFSYQTTNFQCLSQKLYILNRLAEHLKSPRVCTAISWWVFFIDSQTLLFYTFQVWKQLLIKQQYADKVVTHDPGVKAFTLFFGKEEGMGRTQERFFDK